MTAEQQPLTRVQRVKELEQGFKHLGDSDKASFDRALVYNELMEMGSTIAQTVVFEREIAAELRKRLLGGLTELRNMREDPDSWKTHVSRQRTRFLIDYARESAVSKMAELGISSMGFVHE